MPEITPEDVRRYIRGGGGTCPFCHDPDADLEGGPLTVNDGMCWQDITCSCGVTYQDVYYLSAVVTMKDGETVDWIEPETHVIPETIAPCPL